MGNRYNIKWQDEGLCQNVPSQYNTKESRRYYLNHWYSSSAKRTRYAKSKCRECPVQITCLNYALENQEEWGIWGGLDPRERRKLLLKSLAAKVQLQQLLGLPAEQSQDNHSDPTAA